MTKMNRANLTLNEWLDYQNFDANVFWIDEDITQFNSDIWMPRLDEMERRSPAVLTINLNSNGGDAYASFGLYDRIMELRDANIHVRIVGRGIVASAAAMIILQAANDRYATSNTRFLLHEIREWAFFSNDSTSELEDKVTEMHSLTDKIVNILAKRCDQSEKAVRELIARKEVWMSAEQALEWHLIDAII